MGDGAGLVRRYLTECRRCWVCSIFWASLALCAGVLFGLSGLFLCCWTIGVGVCCRYLGFLTGLSNCSLCRLSFSYLLLGRVDFHGSTSMLIGSSLYFHPFKPVSSSTYACHTDSPNAHKAATAYWSWISHTPD